MILSNQDVSWGLFILGVIDNDVTKLSDHRLLVLHFTLSCLLLSSILFLLIDFYVHKLEILFNLDHSLLWKDICKIWSLPGKGFLGVFERVDGYMTSVFLTVAVLTELVNQKLCEYITAEDGNWESPHHFLPERKLFLSFMPSSMVDRY